MTLLLLKVLLAPALVLGTSLAGRRWGPQVAGVLVTLPIVAGPILVIPYQADALETVTEAGRQDGDRLGRPRCGHNGDAGHHHQHHGQEEAVDPAVSVCSP